MQDWSVAEEIPGFDAAWPVGTSLVLTKPRSSRVFIRHGGMVVADFETNLRNVASGASNGPSIAIGGAGPVVTVADVPSGRIACRLETHVIAVGGIDWAGKGPITLDMAGTVRTWTSKGEETSGFDARQQGYGHVCTIGPRGLVATSGENHVRLWQADGSPVSEFAIPIKGAYGLATDPSGRWLANAGADGLVRIWDLKEIA